MNKVFTVDVQRLCRRREDVPRVIMNEPLRRETRNRILLH